MSWDMLSVTYHALTLYLQMLQALYPSMKGVKGLCEHGNARKVMLR